MDVRVIPLDHAFSGLRSPRRGVLPIGSKRHCWPTSIVISYGPDTSAFANIFTPSPCCTVKFGALSSVISRIAPPT